MKLHKLFFLTLIASITLTFSLCTACSKHDIQSEATTENGQLGYYKSLVQKSDAVAYGTVIMAKSYWNEDSTLILTDYIIQVPNAIYGECPSNVSMTIMGGTVDDISFESSYYPILDNGKEYLFLFKNVHSKPKVVMGRTGAISIDSIDQQFIEITTYVELAVEEIKDEVKHE